MSICQTSFIFVFSLDQTDNFNNFLPAADRLLIHYINEIKLTSLFGENKIQWNREKVKGKEFPRNWKKSVEIHYLDKHIVVIRLLSIILFPSFFSLPLKMGKKTNSLCSQKPPPNPWNIFLREKNLLQSSAIKWLRKTVPSCSNYNAAKVIKYSLRGQILFRKEAQNAALIELLIKFQNIISPFYFIFFLIT